MRLVPVFLLAFPVVWACTDTAMAPDPVDLEPQLGVGLVPTADDVLPMLAPGPDQVAYVYVGNPFDEFFGSSYSTEDFVTATLILDEPLPGNLSMADIRGFSGFSFEISDGHQTLTGASEALVSTDEDGNIIGPWSFIRNMGGLLNNGVSTVDWAGQRGVFDWGILSAPSGAYPETPMDSGMKYGEPGTWTMTTREFSCSSVSEIPQSECEALVALYKSTDGDNWTNNTGWLETATPCGWNGVNCLAGGSVGALNLAGKGMAGSLPAEIGDFPNLSMLFLPNNQLSGPIPPEIGNLTNLQNVQLGYNQLTGIPPEIEGLTDVRLLFLNDNQLAGAIPGELGNLGNLEVLELRNNQLSGTIPEGLGDLGSLEALDLRNNQLSGPIPSSLGDLDHLQGLRLAFNQLSGSIPPELGNLSNLMTLDFWSNQLTGPIPPELGNLSNLTELNLEMNQLNGSIPAELGNLSSVVSLTLYRNQLSGSIPPELGNLSSVGYLDLSYNQLTGAIPPELGSLGTLYAFYLNSNELSGLLPLEVAQLGGVIQDTYSPTWCGYVPPGNEDLYMPDTEAYRLADVANLEAICGLGFTTNTETVTEDLTGEVEELVAEEVLNSGQGNALTVKLDQTFKKAEKGQYHAAINIASAFIDHVNELVADGVLTPEEGQSLIERAMILIELWTDMM